MSGFRDYQTVLIPGLPQTEDYARTLFVSGQPWLDNDQIDRLVAGRMN
ncbi:Scr1 family TA system antitoxin-like transcriptional regulator [Nocardiopsis rhodophaea]